MHLKRLVSSRHVGGTMWILLLTTLLVSPAFAQILNFTAQIDGAQANSCVGTSSPSTGTGTFTLDTNTGDVSYNITFDVPGLLGTETVAHVHGTAAECINAGVVYALPVGSPKIGNTVLTAQQMQDMIDGLHYVNIHSDVWPAGEIRGQILLDTQVVPSLMEWAFILLAVTLAMMGTLMVWRRRASTV